MKCQFIAIHLNEFEVFDLNFCNLLRMKYLFINLNNHSLNYA